MHENMLEDLLQCTSCDSLFAFQNDLDKHVYNEHANLRSDNKSAIDRVFDCSICDKTFNLKTKLKKHLELGLCTNQKVLVSLSVCQFCKENISNGDLMEHEENCSKFLDFWKNGKQCVLCHSPIFDNMEAKQHMILVHLFKMGENNDFQSCENCQRVIAISRMASHQNLCQMLLLEDEVLKCKICENDFESRQSGFDHIGKNHLDSLMRANDTFERTAFETVFKEQPDMERFEECSVKDLDFNDFWVNGKCTICDKSIPTKKGGLIHMTRMHKKLSTAHSKLETTANFENTLPDVEWENFEDLDHKENDKNFDSETDNGGNVSNHGDEQANDAILQYDEDKDHLEVNDVDLETKDSKPNRDPNRITKIYTCPCCEDKFVTLNQAEDHLVQFHHLSIDHQRKFNIVINTIEL